VADIIVSVDEPIDATQCGGKENCLGEGAGRCMTHDLWASAEPEAWSSFWIPSRCRSWSTTSWPRACIEDKPHQARHLQRAGGQADPHQRPQLGVRPGQRLLKVLSPAEPLLPMDMTPHFPIYMDYSATTRATRGWWMP
jgi:hypothetical protein